MKLFEIVSAGLGVLLIAWLGYGLIFESRTPEPKYTVLQQYGSIELRQYPELLIAEVSVQGNSEKEKSGTAFRQLAAYIFGGNQKQESIEMTAPVITSEKIEMTAPVFTEDENDIYTMSFVLPERYTLETAPKPNNPRVKIKSLKLNKVYALRFGGYASPEKVAELELEFLEILKKNKINQDGRMILAQYNSPWVFPLFRKNELIFVSN